MSAFFSHLRHGATWLWLVALLTNATAVAQHDKAERYRLAFWNVENYFDTHRDTLRQDAEYTPYGDKHWTYKRYSAKRQQIYKTLVAMAADSAGDLDEALLPVAVGMAEVENSHVLRDLCQGTPLRRYGYRYIHYDSPDRRGADVALLYRPARFHVLHRRAISVSDSTANFYTRHLLEVLGTTAGGDTLVLYVCHLPSKRGGVEAERRRLAIAQQLRHLMDSSAVCHPGAIVVAMGDFNATPYEACLTQGLGITPHGDSLAPFVNLMAGLPRHQGTYYYQGTWSYIDHILVSRTALQPTTQGALYVHGGTAQVLRNLFLLTDDARRLDRKPKPTYRGPKYEGGASDHLPIFFTLVR